MHKFIYSGLRMFIAVLFCCLTSTSLQAGSNESRILTNGANFQGSNGIRVSPDGFLYVTSTVGSRIDVLNPDSGNIIKTFGQQNGVVGADDLAFGPDGRLYWTAFFTGEVMRMNFDGQSEVVATVGPGVNAISFSPQGRLFVTRIFLGDELYEIDPEKIQPPRLVKQNLGGLNAMDFGTDGMLYGPLWFKDQVVKISVDGGELSVISDEFELASAVKFSPDGVLHVLDQHQGTLLAIDIDSGKKSIVGYPGAGSDNLAFDLHGNVFITNSHDGGVIKILPNGKTRFLSPRGLSMPAGIAQARSGELIIAQSQAISFINAQTGAEIQTIHSSIGDPTAPATPLTVSSFADKILVSSWFSNSVQVWNPDTKTISETFMDFQVPLNAVDFENDILVAELAAHRVVRRNITTGDTETLINGIAVPTGLATDDDNAFVADWLTGNVFQFIANGVSLQPTVPIISGLLQPEGMALDHLGRLLIVETGKKRLVRIDPGNPEIETLAENLSVGLQAIPGYPPSWLMSSLVIDNCGRITVTQDLNNSLLRVIPTDVVPGNCRD